MDVAEVVYYGESLSDVPIWETSKTLYFLIIWNDTNMKMNEFGGQMKSP